MKTKSLTLLLPGIFCVAVVSAIVWFQLFSTVDLKEELPVKIVEQGIIYGRIRAFYPDTLYKKYRLSFVLRNKIITETIQLKPDKNIRFKQFYYYIKDSAKLTESERMIVEQEHAQTYLKFLARDGSYYLFVVSGDHGGSANFRTIKVKLYRIEDESNKLVFDKEETYAVDPGIDSNFFTEQLKLLFYRIIMRDDRY